MSYDKSVSDHYFHGDLLNSIEAALQALGKTTDSVTIEDLAPVDEFHIGGRQATEHLIDQLHFSEQGHVLDVGCGLGGAARHVVSKYKNRVTGIDLTPEYVETGTALCAWFNLDQRIRLKLGNALSMPFPNSHFDGGYMLHVAMNIQNKALLFSEIFRVLKPGASFGVYDIMRQKNGELIFPVPWATESSTSKLATADQYKQALCDAGFEIFKAGNRREFALESFRLQSARAKMNSVLPPVGLHILMKESTAVKIENMIQNIANGYMAPVEIIARKKRKIQKS